MTQQEVHNLIREHGGIVHGDGNIFFTNAVQFGLAVTAMQAEPSQDYAELPDAARDVLAERQRQISAEGWTSEHDDDHDAGQMAGAAGCYAQHVNARAWVFGTDHNDYANEPPPDRWPWDESWWKPTTPRRDLVKSGALILAEIERLDRATHTLRMGGKP